MHDRVQYFSPENVEIAFPVSWGKSVLLDRLRLEAKEPGRYQPDKCIEQMRKLGQVYAIVCDRHFVIHAGVCVYLAAKFLKMKFVSVLIHDSDSSGTQRWLVEQLREKSRWAD